MFSTKMLILSQEAFRNCFRAKSTSKMKFKSCIRLLHSASGGPKSSVSSGGPKSSIYFCQHKRSFSLSVRTLQHAVLKTWFHAKSGTARHTPLFLRAEEYSDRVALVDEHRSYTYGNLSSLAHSLCDKICKVFGKQDLNGERIALLCPNNASYVVSQWATWMCNGVSVPLYPSLPPPELQYFITDSDSKMVIATDELAGKLTDIVKEFDTSLLVLKQDDYALDEDDNLLDDEELREKLDRRSSRENHHQQLLDTHQYKNRSALIIYTSGTTGSPKGVVHTHGSLGVHIAAMTKSWGWSANDVVLHNLPLHHVHGILNLLMVPLHIGATCVMLPKFDADKVWSHLLGPVSPEIPRRINVYMAVPTVYAKLIERYEQRFARGRGTKRAKDYIKATCSTKMRLMVSGSAALPEPVLSRWEQITGHRLLERYGMTEVGMALTNPLKGVRTPGAVGNPFPGTEACISRPNVYSSRGYDVIAIGDHKSIKVTPGCEGEEGELLLRGPGLFKEYWRQPEATKKEFTTDGWFKTGDTAVYEKGTFKILGRTSVDILKSGGYKLSALEIERHILSHPHITEVSVIGLPDLTWGQKVTALVVLKPETNLTLEDFKNWASEYLPSYKIPTVLKIVDSLPENALGKVNKKELARIYFPKEIKNSY